MMLCLVALITGRLNAQIKIKHSDSNIQNDEKVERYDSTDISIYQPNKYIGQKVILYQNPGALYTKDYRAFDGKKTYKAPLFTYFEVVGFKPPQEFELKRLDNNDICFFTHFGDGVKPVMAVGYYEDYTQKFMNSSWCIAEMDGVFEVVDIWLRDGGISQRLQSVSYEMESIELNTLWGHKKYDNYIKYISNYKNEDWILDVDLTYGSVDTIEVKKGIPYLVFKSKNNNKYYFDIDKSIESHMEHSLLIGLLPFFTKETSDFNLKKFGSKRWREILNNDVSIGMSKEMVLLSIGKPMDTKRITDSSGVAESWYYHSKNIFFVNNIVKSITDN